MVPGGGYGLLHVMIQAFVGTYRGTDCQKSATDVELKLLTVIHGMCHAHRRAWSAVETTDIFYDSIYLMCMQQF